jgi:hypothetical protein
LVKRGVIKKNIEEQMIPFLAENKFFLKEKKGNVYTFQHTEYSNLRIFFEFSAANQGVCCELWRGNKDDRLMSYDLSLFFDEPESIGDIFRDGFWYFDTEEELVGALKEQKQLLEKKGFDWLFNRLNYNIDEILTRKALERKAAWESATEEERKEITKKIGAQHEEWIKRRVRM